MSKCILLILASPDCKGRLENNDSLREATKNLLKSSQIAPDTYDAVFYTSDYATMWNHPDNVELTRVLSRVYEKDSAVAEVWHGSAELLTGQNLASAKAVAETALPLLASIENRRA